MKSLSMKNGGKSIWYLEVGTDNYITRQIEVFENKNRLKFDENHNCDSYGGLEDQPVDYKILNGEEIN